MREVRDPQVGAAVAQDVGDQGQVEVLDGHTGADGGPGHQRVGEGLVVGAVVPPLFPET